MKDTTSTKAELRSQILVLEQSLELRLVLNRDLVQELVAAHRRIAELTARPSPSLSSGGMDEAGSAYTLEEAPPNPADAIMRRLMEHADRVRAHEARRYAVFLADFLDELGLESSADDMRTLVRAIPEGW